MNGGTLKDFLSNRLSATSTPEVKDSDVKFAGVLVALFWKNNSWQILLNLRSSTVAEHKNEIAFPGGRLEPEDVDIQACALREAHEEMGIQATDVTVLGHLDVVVTRTGYAVSPIVGIIPSPYEFEVSVDEVQEVIEVPLIELLDPKNIRHEARLNFLQDLEETLSFAYEDKLIYGATAKIINQLLELIFEAKNMGISITAEESVRI